MAGALCSRAPRKARAFRAPRVGREPRRARLSRGWLLGLVLIVLVAGCAAPSSGPPPATTREGGQPVSIATAIEERDAPPGTLRATEHVATLLLRAPLDAALGAPNASEAWRAAIDGFVDRFQHLDAGERNLFVDWPEARPVLRDDFLRNASLPPNRIVVAWTTYEAPGRLCNCSGTFAEKIAANILGQREVLAHAPDANATRELDPAFPFGPGTRHVVVLWPPADLWSVANHTREEAAAHDQALYDAERGSLLNRTRELLPEVTLTRRGALVDALDASNLTARDVDVLRALPEVQRVVAS